MDITKSIKDFIEDKKPFFSMDIGDVTPLYVYRIWGGCVAIEEITDAMLALR